MGGFGSGRKFESSKPVSIDFVRCDISALRKLGLFESDNVSDTMRVVELELVGDDYCALRVRICLGTRTSGGVYDSVVGVTRDLWLADTSMFVQLDSSTPHYGGFRYWFICPRANCSRKCRVLYRPRSCNARAFACRQCHRMVYRTQRMAKTSRLLRKIEKSTARLISQDGWLYRPRGMHWRTYHLLCDESDRLNEELWNRMFRGL